MPNTPLDRNLLLDECINRLGQEYLHEKLPNEADDSYNAAVAHCIGALRGMQGEYFAQSSEITAQLPDRVIEKLSVLHGVYCFPEDLELFLERLK